MAKKPVMKKINKDIITIAGKTLLTNDKFEEYWEAYKSENPEMSELEEFYPDMRQEFLDNVVNLEVANLYFDKEGKKTAEFKNKLKKAYEFMEMRLAAKMLNDELLHNLDTGDKALENFYKEVMDKKVGHACLFIQIPTVIEIEFVEFNDEDSAEDFLNKAKKAKANFNDLASKSKLNICECKYVLNDQNDIESNCHMLEEIVFLQPNEISLIEADGNFRVIKIINNAKFMTYSQIKKDKDLKENLINLYRDYMLPELFDQKIEELKDQYDIEVNESALDK